jgi:16S rRNA (guanine527-N7)-methyltransferase
LLTATTVARRFNVSRESLAGLETYVGLLQAWQQKFNLVGPSTLDRIWERHVADSLAVLEYLPPDSHNIADLGSGAGFPGMVVAIVSGRRVHLFESNGKKCAFLREVIRQTGANAAIHQLRVEEFKPDHSATKFTVVLARALAELSGLLTLAEPFLSQGAIGLFHKGQDVETELTEATKYWKLDFQLHRNAAFEGGVILEVREAIRVRSPAKG